MEIRVPQRRSRIAMFSMPDIAFLLLIFLILTVSIGVDEDITTPTFAFARETDVPDTVLVRVLPDGAVEVDGNTTASGRIETALSVVPAGTVVHLLADSEAEYLVVDTVIDALKNVGLLDVILIAEADDRPQ